MSKEITADHIGKMIRVRDGLDEELVEAVQFHCDRAEKAEYEKGILAKMNSSLISKVSKAESLALELWRNLGHDPSCCEDDRPELITELLGRLDDE